MSSDARIDHVGIAVDSLEESEPLYRALLGGGPDRRETVDGEGVRVSFFGRAAGRVELLEPTRDDTPVGRFLERHGPGVHHVCLRVDELEAALSRARESGAEVIPPGIRTGADGRRVAFLHPQSAGGVLVELAEVQDRSDGRDRSQAGEARGGARSDPDPS